MTSHSDDIEARVRHVLPEASFCVLPGGARIVELEYDGSATRLSLNYVVVEDRSWWILSDLDDDVRNGRVENDHVMGVGGATRSLVRAIPNRRVKTALDLGTGNGIIALHLSTLATTVVATDISPRALWIASTNAKLNGVTSIEFREGSLFEPVTGESFELIASNPPFVISPDDGQERVQYRASGLPGDTLLQSLLRQAPQSLQEGGTLVCLANWERRKGKTSWINENPVAGCATWIIERGSQTPQSYVATWLRDGGLLEGAPGYREARNRWLEEFARRNVTDIAYGYVQLRRHSAPVHRVEFLPGNLGTEERFGDAWSSAFDQVLRLSRTRDEDMLNTRWIRASDVEEVRVLTPGTDHIRSLHLAKRTGIERVLDVGSVEAAIVGAADGELTLREIAEAIAHLMELNPAETIELAVEAVREFVACGILTS